MTQVGERLPSLDIQSIIYLNSPDELVRAAESTSHSADRARAEGLISEWRLLLGDCSPEPVLADAHLSRISEFVERAGGKLDYQAFGKNLGSAAGHNRLAAGGDSELLIILNPDALMAYDTVSALITSLRPGVGIVESRQLPIEHPKTFEEYTGDTSWASTACALTSRAAFDAVGGFDSDTFFLYCDDVDYSWQLRIAGYRVVYEPAARLFHDKRLTTTADWPPSAAEIYYSAEAALLLAHKYSRPDLVDELLTRYRTDPTEAIAKAVAEYERRVESGRAPTPIDAGHRVAEFVNGNYAIHRF